MKISKDKKYKTLGGYEFKIYEIYQEYVHGAYRENEDDFWKIVSLCHDALIEIPPYADFKIDDKVLVWDERDEKRRKHYKRKKYFAGVHKNGKPMTWLDGRTSYNESFKNNWDHCIKYEEQENDKI